MWPFNRKPEPEKRQSSSFSDAVIKALVQQAGGGAVTDPAGLWALEACASAYSRAFAAAKITGSDMAVKALTPQIRASIARSLIRRGESLHLIQVQRGVLRLAPIGSWDFRGGPDPDTWTVRADTYGPSRTSSHFVPYRGVVHCKFSYDPARPWSGLSPLNWATSTASLSASLERRLSEEAAGAVGHIIGLPQSPSDDDTDDDETTEGPLSKLQADLAAAKGSTVLTESTSGGWGDAQAEPKRDYQPVRFGADPPQVLSALRTETGKAIVAACGLSIALFDSSDGTAKREAFRQATMHAFEPVAAIVASELSEKLQTEISFDFSSLMGHDIIGRGTAFKNFIAGGMSIERAAALSGLVALEE